MVNFFLITFGKLTAKISRLLNLGSGSTWPGHLSLWVNPNLIQDLLKRSKVKIILIAGTNGKTTTGRLIQTILEKNNKKVFQNQSGANLLNGIASSLINSSNFLGRVKADFAIFEVDENTLPLVLKEITPHTLIILNLFRDQLDRYGEVNTIAKKWGEAIQRLSKETTLILNADDPQIAYFGNKRNALYFGLEDKKINRGLKQHTADTTSCPNCNAKLIFERIYFSHLGVWRCSSCQKHKPTPTITSFSTYPLSGIYNQYNTLAAVLFAKKIGINDFEIKTALKTFKPAFGRQEKITIDGKRVQIFLSKNPTSFNQSLRTIKNLGGKNLLFVLNDRIPDGRDVSWIWDTDIESDIDYFKTISVSGDRCYDMGLRIKYASSFEIKNSFQIEGDLKRAIRKALKQMPKTEMMYILPTYSAMLEVRKILTGRKIL